MHQHLGFAGGKLRLSGEQLRLPCRCLCGTDRVHGVARRFGLRVVALIGFELLGKERLACFQLCGSLRKLRRALRKELFACRNACRVVVLSGFQRRFAAVQLLLGGGQLFLCFFYGSVVGFLACVQLVQRFAQLGLRFVALGFKFLFSVGELLLCVRDHLGHKRRLAFMRERFEPLFHLRRLFRVVLRKSRYRIGKRRLDIELRIARKLEILGGDVHIFVDLAVADGGGAALVGDIKRRLRLADDLELADLEQIRKRVVSCRRSKGDGRTDFVPHVGKRHALGDDLAAAADASSLIDGEGVERTVILIGFWQRDQAHDIAAVVRRGHHVAKIGRHDAFNALHIGDRLYILLRKTDGGHQPEIHQPLLAVIALRQLIHRRRRRLDPGKKAHTQRNDRHDRNKPRLAVRDFTEGIF